MPAPEYHQKRMRVRGRLLGPIRLVERADAWRSCYGIQGLQEHSFSIKSISDAEAIRSRVLQSLERANSEQDPRVRREFLTFVVGGGGYTDVETMAALNDLVRTSVKDYPNVSPEEITTIIVEPGDRLLTELSSYLAAFGQQIRKSMASRYS